MARLLLHTLAAVLLAALACGCSVDDAAGGGVPSGDAQVSFILKLSDASGRTRAAWSEDYVGQQGTAYDNRISPEDLRVALYTAADNAFAAEVDILSYHETATEGEYEFIGTVEAADGVTLSAGEYKLMVFANCGVAGSLGQSGTLGQLAYEYSPDGVKQEEQLIPMWGVTTVTLSLEKGKRDDAGTVDLLRAFAKVEINLDQAIAGTHTITSATLTRYNTSGYCLPAGYANVNKTTELDQEDDTYPSFNPNQTAQQTDLAFAYSDDKKSAYLYIPEYDNSTTEAVIDISLSDGTTGTLRFKPYTDGAPGGEAYSIVRNHIYRYTVNVEQGKLTVECKVMPWQLVTSSIGWMPQPAPTDHNPFYSSDEYKQLSEDGFYILFPRQGFSENRNTVQKVFHDLYEGISTGDDEPNYCVIYRPRYQSNNHNDLYKNSGGATFFFMLTGPEGATWEAHLTNTDDFKFSTSSSNYFTNCTDVNEATGQTYAQEGNVNRVTHGMARMKPYVIEINAVNSYTGTDTDGTVGDYPENLKDEDDWEPYFGDAYLTDWGKDKWYGHKVVDTEFYITVKLSDGTEYELTINPPYTGDDAPDTNFEGNRRYAGTDTRIWIRQLRAMQGWGYDNMAKNISPTATGDNLSDIDRFQWWRVNPYWNK